MKAGYMKRGPWAELTGVVCCLYHPDSTGPQGLHTVHPSLPPPPPDSVRQGGDGSHCSVSGVEGTDPGLDAEE